jgi:type II secretory pathway component PulF
VVTLQKKELTRNNRGSLSDYPSIIIMIFGGATVLIIAAMLVTNIKSGFSSAGLDVTAFTDLEAVWTTFDYSISFLIIAFM